MSPRWEPGPKGTSADPLRVVLLSTGHRWFFDVVQQSRHHVVAVIGQKIRHPDDAWLSKAVSRVVDEVSSHPSLPGWCKKNSVPYMDYADSANFKDRIAALQPDVLIVHVASKISSEVLDKFRYGGINIHPSWLPAYRGASPLVWQAIDRVEELSISIHKMTERFDEGEILLQGSVPKKPFSCEKEQFEQLDRELCCSSIEGLLDRFSEYYGNAQRQPAKCSTRYAKYLCSANLAERVKLDELSADQFLNLINVTRDWRPAVFYADSPYAAFRWRAVRVVDAAGLYGTHPQHVLVRDGLGFYVLHGARKIEMEPVLSVKALAKLFIGHGGGEIRRRATKLRAKQ